MRLSFRYPLSRLERSGATILGEALVTKCCTLRTGLWGRNPFDRPIISAVQCQLGVYRSVHRSAPSGMAAGCWLAVVVIKNWGQAGNVWGGFELNKVVEKGNRSPKLPGLPSQKVACGLHPTCAMQQWACTCRAHNQLRVWLP